ncbi:MAG: HigA family addiction module antitoxin [Alkaliphilus sp.]
MAKNMNGLSYDLIIHPGETLKELLDENKMSQRELAIRTDVTEKHIRNIVNCQKPISVNVAKKMEYALEIDASFWVNLQANYDKELMDFEEINGITEDERKTFKKLRDIVEYFKQEEMLERGSNDSVDLINFRKKMNVSNLERLPDILQTGAYRVASATNVDKHILFAWLKMCDIITSKIEINTQLDVDGLKSKIHVIKDLMFKDASNLQSKLIGYFAECGIKFSIVKHFKGAPVQGVIKKNEDGSISLIMTIIQKFADIFWFTLFHEIAHIINRDVKNRLVDYISVSTDCEIEKIADEFARNTLISSKEYDLFVSKQDFLLSSIDNFCQENRIPNYILIGRLQKDKYIPYNWYSAEKVRYERN